MSLTAGGHVVSLFICAVILTVILVWNLADLFSFVMAYY